MCIASILHAGSRFALCAALSASLVACATPSSAPRVSMARGHEISAEKISRLSSSSTAWDVLQQSGIPLSLLPSIGSSATRLTRRGVGSIHPSENLLVIVDGVRTHGVDLLYQISSRDIQHIRILSGIDASTHYGMNAGSGAIVIQTKQGR